MRIRAILPCLGLVLQSMLSRHVLAFNYSTFESKFLSGEYGLSGAVDQNGNSVSSLNQTQGLRYQQCVEICGDGYQLEGWTGICSQVANSLLPWIALAAQLPFSTTDKWQDMFTVVLVIGSPILAMYSLLLSLFNAKWVKEDCGRVARSTLHGEGHMNHVARVLAACQHVPLAIKDQRALCWSITGQENRNWWVKLAEMLKDKERGFPASLWAQIGVAALTYIFTIIDIFTNSEGYFCHVRLAYRRRRKRHFGDRNDMDMDCADRFGLVCSTHTVHSS